ncbi:MAG: oligosaccharide flippase family protein [Parvularcula sp.]|jgi:O-antigen/teichoic acid export membrane protein|nr:oligosaccharide flippase family protein [Parvularcula sp.]
MADLSRLRNRALDLVGKPGTLRGRVARSASWVTIGYGAEMVLRLGSSLILTRLLSPAAFGIMATAQVFLYTAVMLSDVGVRSLVITHERSDAPEFLRTVWTFQIVRGLILAAIVALLGQLLGVAQRLGWFSSENSFAEPMLPAIIGVIGITLAFEGLKSTNEHVMARDLRQDILVKLETGTKILSTFITVGAVWITRSVWGFVYAALIVAALRAILSQIIVPGPRMQFAWNRDDVSYVINRGKWIGVSSWTTLAGSLADKVLIGGFFGSSVLGLYTLALSITDALHSLITQVTKAIALPVLFEMLRANRSDITAAFLRMRNSIMIVSSAIGIALFFAANTLVSIFYDPRYHDAGSIAAILSLKYFIFHFDLNMNFIRAKAQFRTAATFNLAGTALLWVVSVSLAMQEGLTPVLAVLALSPIVERGLASGWMISQGVLTLRVELIYYVIAIFLSAACLFNLR